MRCALVTGVQRVLFRSQIGRKPPTNSGCPLQPARDYPGQGRITSEGDRVASPNGIGCAYGAQGASLSACKGESRLGKRSDALPRNRADRKSVVEGKSVSVRVDLGGRRIIKNNNMLAHNQVETHILLRVLIV